jgi:antirestriction protein
MVAIITATETDLTNTEWLRTLAISNATVFEQIKSMVNEEGYPLHDIRDFIDTHGLNAFTEGAYHAWEELEKNYSREAIEAWVEYAGIQAIESLEDAYMGEFNTPEEFAEYYFTDLMGYEEVDTLIGRGIVIDWEATWDTNLRHDFDFEGGFVFNRNV